MPLFFRENFTPGSIPFAGSNRFLAENNSSLFWDNTNLKLGIRTAAPTAILDINTNTDTVPSAVGYHFRIITVDGSQTGGQVFCIGNNGIFGFGRANRTAGALSALLANQRIGSFTAFGFGATALLGNRAAVHFETEENWTDTANGTRIIYATCLNGAATPGGTERWRITNDGKFLGTSAIGGLGYRTGAGGTVNQATNKATGVTLNTVTGLINMDAANLNADTAVTFTLTDSAIEATDLLLVWHISGGTAGSYTVTALCAAGSAAITVRNITPANLAEAITLRFALMKSVDA